MNDNARLETLRRLPELAPFGPAELRSLLPYLDEVIVGPGEVLATAGRPSREYVVVLEGSLKARGCAGVRRLEPGESSGWREMWEQGLNRETLVTTSAARLLVMGRAQFRAVTAIADRPAPVDERLSRGADLDLSA
jgi:CRP-like cAMP-binding protein